MIGALILARAVDDEQLEVQPGVDARTKLVSLTLPGKAKPSQAKLTEGYFQWQRANERAGALLGAELSASLHDVAGRCLLELGALPDSGTAGPSRKRP